MKIKIEMNARDAAKITASLATVHPGRVITVENSTGFYRFLATKSGLREVSQYVVKYNHLNS